MVVEGYEVLRKLADGTVAEVFLARPRTGSPQVNVLVELLRAELAGDSAIASRFADDGTTRPRIAHPNLVHPVRTGTTSEGRPWRVLGPVGESLASRLASRGALSLEALLPIALQVCEGLEFMHRSGTVHGHLKPATVYVQDRPGAPPQVKLVDFGLSSTRLGRTTPRPPGITLVEPEYLAPERIRGQRCTPRTDVYGAGVLFYELLTGFPPFTGADSAAVRRRQLEEPPAPLPASGALLAPILERCLAKDPEGRYPSAGALAAALKKLSDQVLSAPVEVEVSLEAPEQSTSQPALSTVGSYELVQPLGEGAMGRVFLARHQTLDRRVALKILKPELARSRVEVDRFIQEAQAVNKIRHEHIVEIYDCVDETLSGGERRVYFVMELLQGQSLGELLRDGPLPLPRALRLMRQVALALDAVHRVGVVHRDVKPDNIFIATRNGSDFVKVLDFGVAKLRDQGVEMSSDGSPVVVGTPLCMAPEQLLGQKTDHRADVYGLGVLLYRLVVGQPPFATAKGLERLVKAIVHEKPAPLPARTLSDETVPEALRALVAACLEKDPERRPQTMAEVGSALDGLLAEPAVPVRTAAEPKQPRHPARRSGRKMTLALPLALGGMALGVAVAVLARPSAPAAPVLQPEPPAARQPAPPAFAPIQVAEVPLALPLVEVPISKPAPETPTSRRVVVTSQPRGARVLRVDTGEDLGVTPVGVAVPLDGALSLRLVRDGVSPATVRIGPDSPSPAVVKLQPRKRAKGGKGAGRDDLLDPFASRP
ncbi:MAG: serine/threonine-protein kinase [Myxococcales bacterium]